MPVGTTRPLSLFLNNAAGAGEGDKLLELWKTMVPDELLGPIFQVRSKDEYEHQLDQALTFCQTSEATLVVAGGDGTFNGVVRRAGPMNVTLGLIPTGTFNYFARSHAVPEDFQEAIEFLLRAKPQAMSMAFVNEYPFIVSVSIGLHPTVIAEREVHTRYVGRSRLVAWLSGIWTVARRRHVSRLRIETSASNKKISTPLLMVNYNSAQLLGLDHRFQFSPERFALLRLRPASYWGLVGFILRGLTGHILDEGSLECEYTEVLNIRTQGKRERVALDGELVELESPLRFTIRKGYFQCLLPGKTV